MLSRTWERTGLHHQLTHKPSRAVWMRGSDISQPARLAPHLHHEHRATLRDHVRGNSG